MREERQKLGEKVQTSLSSILVFYLKKNKNKYVHRISIKPPSAFVSYLEDIIEVVVETIQTKLINYGIYR